MPNFALSARLRENFAPATKYGLLNESRAITETLNLYGTAGTRSLAALQAVAPTVKALVGNPRVDLALLFIDITSFSVRTAGMTAPAIAQVLDAYYAEVLPIIYEFDGEVEKIIGDGIIAVFGRPFTPGTTRTEWLRAAERCAGKIGRGRYAQEYTVKIALHYGSLMYYHNDKTTVDEFYAIGKPMTELFRLESEGIDKRITYYVGAGYDEHRRGGYSVLDTWWQPSAPRTVDLKGVTYKSVIDLY